jgi:hypothetical protein
MREGNSLDVSQGARRNVVVQALATRWKEEGSRPEGVFKLYQLSNPSGWGHRGGTVGALGPVICSASNTNENKIKTNSVAFSPQENYTD